MKKLIINADGFGFTSGINKGIIESIEYGVVTSVSCNVNFEHIKDIEKLNAEYSNISIGIHLNVNVGKPILKPDEIPSLVNSKGEFWSEKFKDKFFSGKIKLCDIEKELDAQIRKLKAYGVSISHMDGHQNKHLYPGYFDIVLKLGKKYNIKKIRCHRRYLFLRDCKSRDKQIFFYYFKNPQRILSHWYAGFQMKKARRDGYRMADRLITPAYIDKTFKYNLDTWLAIVKKLPVGINEIYCHPGYVDDELRKYAKYLNEREEEVKIMTNKELRNAIEAENIQLISFNEV